MAQPIEITLDLAAIKTSARTEIYKWGEANRNNDNYQRIYELEHSTGDNVDVHLLNIYAKQRVDRIADIVSEYLSNLVYSSQSQSDSSSRASASTDSSESEPTTPPTPPTPPTPEPETVTFSLTLPGGWNANTFASLAKLFEDYVLDGTVADWFTNAGVEQGKVFNTRALEHAVGIQKNIYRKNSTI